MKAMVCEMCGSNDLMKKDGAFVCQHCGTKYSVEEAKKLFVEGIVKIDHSDEIRNLYDVARRARKENNSTTAQKYYEMLLEKDASNWEPVFYSVYYTYGTMKNGEIGNKTIEIKNCLNTVSLMLDDLDEESRKTALKELEESVKEIIVILQASSTNYHNMVPMAARDPFGKRDRTIYIAELAFAMADCLRKNELSVNAAEMYKIAITILATENIFVINADNLTNLQPVNYNSILERMNDASEYIRQVEPNYLSEREIWFRDNGDKKGGCYVATAVYGSYDCPQVWTLRRFRDFTLAETWYGRAFIRTYYAISPTLVKWFGQTEWFKNLWKPTLDRMVDKLNSNGVSNQPYNDYHW